VKVTAVLRYPLPEGLKAGAWVKVVQIDVGQHTVENKAGPRWKVAMANIDPGLIVIK
jgi:hypothetical protein